MVSTYRGVRGSMIMGLKSGGGIQEIEEEIPLQGESSMDIGGDGMGLN